MSFLQKIIGYTSGNGAEIDADNQLLVKPSLTDSQTGKIRFMSENNSESGGTLYLKSPETSSDYRLRIGQDSVLFEDNFNATSQNTATWRHVFSTMTMTQSGGFLNVNAGSAIAEEQEVDDHDGDGQKKKRQPFPIHFDQQFTHFVPLFNTREPACSCQDDSTRFWR
jgi:hypothetical protein